MAAPHIFPTDPHAPETGGRDIAAAKAAARAAAIAARAACDPSVGAALARHVLESDLLPAGAVVSGFWPMDNEIDIRPLLHAAHERGHTVVLPITPRLGHSLTFGEWWPGMEMVRERFGTFRPTGPERDPDVLLVPLLAFDRTGRRLGYGGGFYDRTLARLPGRVAVGCAFAAQELDEVPADHYDARLAAVATERGVLRFEGV